MNLDAFAAHLRDNDLAPRTVQTYCNEVQRFAAWFEQSDGAPLTPAGLTPSAVTEYKAHLQTVKRHMPATINRKLLAVRAYGAWAVSSGEIEANPAGKVKLLGEVPLQPRSLSHKDLYALRREIEKAVNNARTDPAKFLAARNLAIFRVLELTGLRVGELCALVVEDVVVGERSGSMTVQHGKGNKRRTVPLNTAARRALADWFEHIEEEMQEGAPLFCDHQGQRLKPRGVQRMLADAAGRAGVACTPHTLRHTFAKSILDAGAPITTVAALMGHGRLESTRRYLQPSERDLEQAVSRLEE